MPCKHMWFTISNQGYGLHSVPGYAIGGRIRIDQQKTAFEVDNWVWAASFGFTIGKTQSVKLTWLSGRTQNLAGRDSDNLLLGWSMRWGN